MRRTITLSDVEPAPLSMRHPLGVNFELLLTMLDQRGAPVDPTPQLPQLALLSRSKGSIYATDMTVYDAPNGISRATVPGTVLLDRNGYNVELYLRKTAVGPSDPPVPTALAATGVLALQGDAYTTIGPLGMISVPVVTGPAGPPGPTGVAGPTGSPGRRGSVWYTGSGAPGAIAGVLPADMYLDETTGDVYRYDGTTLMWVKGTF
jgi:hypothetical protein